MKTKFYGFAIATLMAGALASCSNDVKEPAIDIQPEENLTVSLVHAPDFYAWSGKQILGDTRSAGTRAEGEEENMVLPSCACPEGCEMCETLCDGETGWCECNKEYYRHDNEVEVSLSINDIHAGEEGQKYEGADLWTKLSIHVRKATDVTVVMPVPTAYVCESDDLVILKNHEEGFTSLPDDQIGHSVTYNVNGTPITLTLTFDKPGTDEAFPAGKIIVTTQGITEGLINALFEENGDGINFEIWNYYQSETITGWDVENNEWIVTPTQASKDGIATLKGYLDDSTIGFAKDYPDFYINSFGVVVVENDNIFENTDQMKETDCIVKPYRMSPGDNGLYFEKIEGQFSHLNGSRYNHLYVLNNVDRESEGYKAHVQE